ncbi:hypothetical protein ACFCVU_28235 [Peribacillus butanolivorans]|uniref:hypothetical protein n=1 Tax=Peribacillus butanolivorans TaxID=421767 RepID=UPI0035E077D0
MLIFTHSSFKKNYTSIFVPLMGLAIANIASTDLLPSDILGGYVYGGVWISFNFLLFEMLRLVLDKVKIENKTQIIP